MVIDHLLLVRASVLDPAKTIVPSTDTDLFHSVGILYQVRSWMVVGISVACKRKELRGLATGVHCWPIW